MKVRSFFFEIQQSLQQDKEGGQTCNANVNMMLRNRIFCKQIVNIIFFVIINRVGNLHLKN